MRTIKTILLLPILSLILSCSYNDKRVDLAITKAEELLDVCPDSSPDFITFLRQHIAENENQ